MRQIAKHFSDRHSKAAQLPEATECSKPVSKPAPTAGTLDPSFQHLSPHPTPFFPTFASGDKRVVGCSVWE